VSALIEAVMAEHQAVVADMAALSSTIERMGDLCAESLEGKGRIYLCGNGGSAADAQHIAAELIGRFVNDRRALPAVALTTDTSALTAISNDYGYDHVFSRQIEGLCVEGDVLIAISTSGNSPSILEAVASAKALGATTLGLTGKSGGELKDAVDCALVVPSSTTARIQEMHILVGHLLCELIESRLSLA